MSNTLPRGQYFGGGAIDIGGPWFSASLRRATIPAHDLQEHAHEDAHFVLAFGSGYISAAVGIPDVAPTMTLIFSPPGTIHRDWFRDTGSYFLGVDIDPSLAPKNIVDPTYVESADARHAAGRVAGRLAFRRDDDDEICDAILTMLAETGVDRHPPSPPPPWLTDAHDALRDLSSRPGLKIGDIAASVGVHAVHFSRIFKNHFDCTPSAMLRRHRTWRAAAMVSEGRALAEIALDCGFTDQSHLTRSFIQIFGTSPGRFRNAFA